MATREGVTRAHVRIFTVHAYVLLDKLLDDVSKDWLLCFSPVSYYWIKKGLQRKRTERKKKERSAHLHRTLSELWGFAWEKWVPIFEKSFFVLVLLLLHLFILCFFVISQLRLQQRNVCSQNDEQYERDQ